MDYLGNLYLSRSSRAYGPGMTMSEAMVVPIRLDPIKLDFDFPKEIPLQKMTVIQMHLKN